MTQSLIEEITFLRPLNLPGVQLGLLFLFGLLFLKHRIPFARLIGRPTPCLPSRLWLTVLLVGLASLLISVTLAAMAGIPAPEIHDEFSYLLAGDTFARGRLTNPTHEFWEHFETFHVLQRPSYMSKFPPGQGMFLAIGQIITGLPIVGVWLSTALACGAICWMLAAWVPRRWAAAGGWLSVLYPPLLTWSQMYWGGSVAALGGALVLGGLGRVIKHGRAGHSFVMGLGIAILAHSRPFEGLVYTLILMMGLFTWVTRGVPPARPVRAGRIALPLLIALILTGVSVLYYNWRITGSALRLPYVAYEEQYSTVPVLLVQRVRPEPERLSGPFLASVRDWALPLYQRQQTASGWSAELPAKLVGLLPFLTPWAILLPMGVFVVGVRRDRRIRLMVAAFLIMLLAMVVETWTKLHYAAPATGLVLLMAVAGLRRLSLWRPRRWQLTRARVLSLGIALFLAMQIYDSSVASPYLFPASACLALCAMASVRRVPVWHPDARQPGRTIARAVLAVWVIGSVSWWADDVASTNGSWGRQRREKIEQLKRAGGSHLILVRYGGLHSFHDEWVYNSADVDRSEVVWARELEDPARNLALIRYFAGRRVWLLDDNGIRIRFGPYPVP